MSREAMKLALDYIVATNASSEFWLVPASNLNKTVTALREALAEQPAQQEPVAWGVDWGKAGDIPCVSIIKRLPGGGIEVVAVEYAPYSYTSPPAQRTWVGLSDEEYINITDSVYHKGQGLVAYYKAIEAKLRSKNNG